MKAYVNVLLFLEKVAAVVRTICALLFGVLILVAALIPPVILIIDKVAS